MNDHQNHPIRRISSHFAQYFWPLVTGILVAVVFLQSQQLTQQAEPRAVDRHGYSKAVARAMPSVVNIYTIKVTQQRHHPLLNNPLFKRFAERRGGVPQNRVERGLGSGVIVRSDGYVLTNHHVIEDADRIRVMLADGRERIAQVIGTDVATDLAVLKIDLDNLTAVHFANPDSVIIGDVALAIGNPYGIGQTVTQGIISATGRYGLRLNTYENYIQTDAAINQGNSGGALVNIRGELIGINSVLYSQTGGSTGIGFAIPNDTAQHVLNSIIDHGEVIRGWLGISVDEITPVLADQFQLKVNYGLIVTELTANGPAAQAGIHTGDIITHIEGVKAGSGNAGMHQIAQTSPGKKITILAFREGAAQSFLVEVGKKPKQYAKRQSKVIR